MPPAARPSTPSPHKTRQDASATAAASVPANLQNALENIIPAFSAAKRSRLAALVSGSPDKARAVAAQHGVKPEAVYDYAGFDHIRDNPEVQAVHVVLLNALHREYVLRAAAAGKQVLCEKPVATSATECEEMIAACKQAGRTVMTACRKKALAGGGCLPDAELYCLNAARFLTGEEPVEVFGRTYSPPGDPRYAEVEESISFTLRFPSGVLANCAASYGMHESRTLRVHAPGGAITFDNAFAYTGHRLMDDPLRHDQDGAARRVARAGGNGGGHRRHGERRAARADRVGTAGGPARRRPGRGRTPLHRRAPPVPLARPADRARGGREHGGLCLLASSLRHFRAALRVDGGVVRSIN